MAHIYWGQASTLAISSDGYLEVESTSASLRAAIPLVVPGWTRPFYPLALSHHAGGNTATTHANASTTANTDLEHAYPKWAAWKSSGTSNRAIQYWIVESIAARKALDVKFEFAWSVLTTASAGNIAWRARFFGWLNPGNGEQTATGLFVNRATTWFEQSVSVVTASPAAALTLQITTASYGGGNLLPAGTAVVGLNFGIDTTSGSHTLPATVDVFLHSGRIHFY